MESFASSQQPFPVTCLSEHTDVIFSLRSLCLQALARPETNFDALPDDVLEQVDLLAELYRKNPALWPTVGSSVDSVFVQVKRALLRRGQERMSLRCLEPVELVSLFNKQVSGAGLTVLQIFGASVLPLENIVTVCPNLVKLDLRCIEADTLYDPIGRLAPTLKCLRINSCDGAFSAVGDGAHDWLFQLTGLEELNLRYTSVSGRMLPPLVGIRELDLSFTFVHDIGAIAAQLQSVERLVYGDDSNSEVVQLHMIPKVSPHMMPQLKHLDVFLFMEARVNETVEQRLQVLRPLTEWAKRKKLQSLTMYMNRLMSEIELPVASEGDCAIKVLLHRPIHDVSNPSALVHHVFQCGWRLHQFAEQNLELPKQWIGLVFRDMLEALFFYRHNVSQFGVPKSALATLVSMLTLLVRYDHAAAGKLGLCSQIIAPNVISHFVMMLRDALQVAHTSNQDAARLFVTTLLRLFNWSYDQFDIERTVQYTLIHLGLHELVADALLFDKESWHAGLVIYGTLSSCQPFKAKLLMNPIQDLLVRILDPKERHAINIRESATTILGNLSSWAPNTVKLVTECPELLDNLVALLASDENDIAFGATYLLGNLAYIQPRLCGKVIFRMANFGPTVRANFQRNFGDDDRTFPRSVQTTLFWNLWSRCHARDAFEECTSGKQRGASVARFDNDLNCDIERYVCVFNSDASVACLWTNLIGVRRLLSSPVIPIRAFSFWLLGNIAFQPRHRGKLARAFDWLFPLICNANSATVGDATTVNGGETWLSKQRVWLAAAVEFLVENTDFAMRFVEEGNAWKSVCVKLELDPRVVARVLSRAEVIAEEEHERRRSILFF